VNKKRAVFPFTAIIGQEEMKLALLLNIIDPKIVGVIIMGIAVRANLQPCGR
jgi:magnesium chelatase subunit I